MREEFLQTFEQHRLKFQKISEEKIVRADIGVITNVRYDHLDEMGESLEEITNSL